MPEKHQEDNDRDRYPKQPKKNCGHFSFLRVLMINSAVGKSFRALNRRNYQDNVSAADHGVLCSWHRNTVMSSPPSADRVDPLDWPERRNDARRVRPLQAVDPVWQGLSSGSPD